MLVQCKLRDESTAPFLGAILWYSDPTCLEKEMHPPVLTAYSSMDPPSVRYLSKVFTLVYRQNDAYVTFHGCIQAYGETDLRFYSRSKCFLLNFEPAYELNTKIIHIAQKTGKIKSNALIPVLEVDGCVFRPRDKVKESDKVWVSGLLVSRMAVTMMSLRYSWNTFSLNSSHKLKSNEGADVLSNMFYAWWPSPKPSNLGEWLTYLSKKMMSSFPKEWVSDSTPFIEGFYRMAIVNANQSESKYDATGQLVFNDGASELQQCYTDYPYVPNPEERAAGFVTVSNRVRISLSIPLRFRAPEGKCLSDWGYHNHFAMGYLFLLPAHVKEDSICGPFRSSPGLHFQKKHKRSSGMLKTRTVMKTLVQCANNDANINARSYPRKAVVDRIIRNTFSRHFRPAKACRTEEDDGPGTDGTDAFANTVSRNIDDSHSEQPAKLVTQGRTKVTSRVSSVGIAKRSADEAGLPLRESSKAPKEKTS